MKGERGVLISCTVIRPSHPYNTRDGARRACTGQADIARTKRVKGRGHGEEGRGERGEGGGGSATRTPMRTWEKTSVARTTDRR